jgi:predicted Zn-dependent protease
MAIGGLLTREGRAKEALGEYDAELKLRPNDPATYFHQGQALMFLGQDNDAEAAFRRALALGADIPEINKLLGRIYVRRRDYPQAIRTLSDYLTAMPEDSQAHYLLGQAFQRTGNQEAAAREFDLQSKYSMDLKSRVRAERELLYLQELSDPNNNEVSPPDSTGPPPQGTP